MKRRYYSDYNRILSLIYEDQPLPPRVSEEPAVSFSPDASSLQEWKKTQVPAYPKYPGHNKRTGKRSRKALLPEPEEAPLKEIRIDLSALDEIRRKAGRTMEKLITEDDLDQEPEMRGGSCFLSEADPAGRKRDSAEIAANEMKSGMKSGEAPEVTEGEDVLDNEERKVLSALLSGDISFDFLPRGSIVSVIVDRINEKLFEEFGDTVIENGSPPELIEDYREDLLRIAGCCRE